MSTAADQRRIVASASAAVDRWFVVTSRRDDDAVGERPHSLTCAGHCRRPFRRRCAGASIATVKGGAIKCCTCRIYADSEIAAVAYVCLRVHSQSEVAD